MELISVIVPIYNVEKYLNRCIKSIVNQTFKNLEIILVDDGSSDKSPEICDEWAKKDKRIKVFHKKNGGLSDARNVGLKAAFGKYIGFVDSDDWIADKMYEKLLQSINETHSQIAACSVEMIWENTKKRKMLTPQINCVMEREEAQKALLEETILKQPVWYKLYEKSVLKDIWFEKGKLYEDDYWSYQVVHNAHKVSVIDYIGYFYMQHKDSIMGSGYRFKCLDVIEAYCNRYLFFEFFEPNLMDTALITLWEKCIYHGTMSCIYLKGKQKEMALSYLESVLKKYPISNNNIKELKLSHKLWIYLAKISLRSACKIKKRLRVGI